jgi:murein DD-endopeptidase MepM/ murein hydrolase activator NlpD
MGSRNVRVGQTVKAGQPIGTVADYAKYGTPSHIHMGVQ